MLRGDASFPLNAALLLLLLLVLLLLLLQMLLLAAESWRAADCCFCCCLPWKAAAGAAAAANAPQCSVRQLAPLQPVGYMLLLQELYHLLQQLQLFPLSRACSSTLLLLLLLLSVAAGARPFYGCTCT